MLLCYVIILSSRHGWMLPTEGPDSDAFDEELYTEFP